MAMHKKLNVGSILFTFIDPRYDNYQRQRGNKKYRIEFKILYVYNRRERTSGATVPLTLIPTLDKFGIRHKEFHHQDYVYAVGCRNHVYHSCWSDMPYPELEDIQEAKRVYDALIEEGSGEFSKNEFVQDFKEKKLTNKEMLFSLYKPLNEYVEKENHF